MPDIQIKFSQVDVFQSTKLGLLFIVSSTWVLRTPNASQNLIFQYFLPHTASLLQYVLPKRVLKHGKAPKCLFKYAL